MGSLLLKVTFYVDPVSQKVTTLDECSTCQAAISLNARALLAMEMHTLKNRTGVFVAGTVHNAEIVTLETIDSQISVNLDNLRKVLNTLVGNFIGTINNKLGNGIYKIPIIGVMSLSDLVILVE
jgi:hypothetical protein